MTRRQRPARPLSTNNSAPRAFDSPASTPTPRVRSSSASGFEPASWKFTDAKSGSSVHPVTARSRASESRMIHAPVLTPIGIPGTAARMAVSAPATSVAARLSFPSAARTCTWIAPAPAAAVDRGFEKTRHAGRSAHRLLQLVEVELADLGHLGGDDGAAIALVRIAAVVVAVVLLRRVEHVEWDDGRHDRVIPHLLGLELTDHLLHDRLLLGR